MSEKQSLSKHWADEWSEAYKVAYREFDASVETNQRALLAAQVATDIVRQIIVYGLDKGFNISGSE